MRWMLRVLVMFVAVPVVLQTTAQTVPSDPFKPLAFLQGTWQAKAVGDGGAMAMGSYTFQSELGGHVMARHSTSAAGCKGPATFDCEHGDLLYVYPEGAGLKAIYMDNEGHVVHYDVTTPSATSVMLLSDGSQPGPTFRLTYELKGSVMAGKFQMKMPGGTDWKSYLEWSGGKSSK